MLCGVAYGVYISLRLTDSMLGPTTRQYTFTNTFNIELFHAGSNNRVFVELLPAVLDNSAGQQPTKMLMEVARAR